MFVDDFKVNSALWHTMRSTITPDVASHAVESDTVTTSHPGDAPVRWRLAYAPPPRQCTV